MPTPARNRWPAVSMALVALVAIPLCLTEQHGSRAKRAAPLAGRAHDAAAQETSATAPEEKSGPGVAAEKVWRLGVELRDENGRPVSGRVYVMDARGDLLSAVDTEPPAQLVQTVRGTVSVIAYAWYCVPQYVENLASTTSDVRSLVVTLDRGPGIGGRITDDTGEPVTSERAWGVSVRARPLDPPTWLLRLAESWKSQTDPAGRWCVFEAPLEDDGTFHIEGLPPGRYEITCEQPQMRDVPDEPHRKGTLLAPEPVTAAVGDDVVRVVCRRAVEIHLHFMDAEAGTRIPLESVVRWEVTGHREGYTWSGCSNGGQGPILPVRPGSNLALKAHAEGYLTNESAGIAVSRDPGRQDVNVTFRRDSEGSGAVELSVVDEIGDPVFPLMIGRLGVGMRREDNRDGRYAQQVPAGRQSVRLESPGDYVRMFTREWRDGPGDYAGVRAYLPVDVDVDVPRGGRIARPVKMQRAALIWVRQEIQSARPRARILKEAVEDGVRLFRGEKEIDVAFRRLDESRGFVAAVEPGEYLVKGSVGAEIVQAEVVAKAAEVAEVWLRAERAK